MDNGMILWFLINLSPHTCTQFVRFYYFLPLLRYSRNVFDLNERKKTRPFVNKLGARFPFFYFSHFHIEICIVPHIPLTFIYATVCTTDTRYRMYKWIDFKLLFFIILFLYFEFLWYCLTAPIAGWRFYIFFISIYYFFSAGPCVFLSFRSRNKNHKRANQTKRSKNKTNTVDKPDRDLTAQLLRTNCSGKSKRFGAIPCWRHSCWCGGAVVVAQRWLKMWARWRRRTQTHTNSPQRRGIGVRKSDRERERDGQQCLHRYIDTA